MDTGKGYRLVQAMTQSDISLYLGLTSIHRNRASYVVALIAQVWSSFIEYILQSPGHVMHRAFCVDCCGKAIKDVSILERDLIETAKPCKKCNVGVQARAEVKLELQELRPTADTPSTC